MHHFLAAETPQTGLRTGDQLSSCSGKGSSQNHQLFIRPSGCPPAGKAFDDMRLWQQQRHFFSRHAQILMLFFIYFTLFVRFGDSWCSIVMTGPF